MQYLRLQLEWCHQTALSKATTWPFHSSKLIVSSTLNKESRKRKSFSKNGSHLFNWWQQSLTSGSSWKCLKNCDFLYLTILTRNQVFFIRQFPDLRTCSYREVLPLGLPLLFWIIAGIAKRASMPVSSLTMSGLPWSLIGPKLRIRSFSCKYWMTKSKHSSKMS